MIRTDVVVVGSGVAGALVAFQLAKAGAKVTILEAGPPVDRDEAVEVFRAATAKVPESPYPNTAWAPHPTVLEIGVPGTGYFIQDGPDPFGSTYERIVGGTTWHWLGTTPRLLPSDFRMKTLFGVGVDWPISYADLEPWYVKAEYAIGVAGDSANDQGSPRIEGLPDAEVPTSYLDSVIDKAAPHHRTEGRVDPAGPEHRDLQRPAPLRRQLQLHPDLPDRGEVRRADPPGPGRRARSQADPGRGRARHPAQHRRHRAWCGLPASQRHRRDGAGPCRGMAANASRPRRSCSTPTAVTALATPRTRWAGT